MKSTEETDLEILAKLKKYNQFYITCPISQEQIVNPINLVTGNGPPDPPTVESEVIDRDSYEKWEKSCESQKRLVTSPFTRKNVLRWQENQEALALMKYVNDFLKNAVESKNLKHLELWLQAGGKNSYKLRVVNDNLEKKVSLKEYVKQVDRSNEPSPRPHKRQKRIN